ncbi:hypothetical protein EV368DRAFT_88042 [Lentinula lateritia]|nr:hypothetical protein EV368DRAFT_88042 [Lentinula lateritia]
MSAASHPKDDDDDDLFNRSSSLILASNLRLLSAVTATNWQWKFSKMSIMSFGMIPQESPCITYDNCEAIKFEEMDHIIVENPFDEREELSYHCGSPASRDMEKQEFSNTIKPHTDAPEFSLDEFSLRNKDRDAILFPWKNLEDLNRDIIDVEVARILHYEHNLTFEEIDELGVLRLSLRGPDDNPKLGLLSISSRLERNSSVRWESSRSVKLQLPRFPTNPNFSHRTLLETLNAGSQYFCANPSCIASHCIIHNMGDIRNRS